MLKDNDDDRNTTVVAELRTGQKSYSYGGFVKAVEHYRSVGDDENDNVDGNMKDNDDKGDYYDDDMEDFLNAQDEDMEDFSTKAKMTTTTVSTTFSGTWRNRSAWRYAKEPFLPVMGAAPVMMTPVQGTVAWKPLAPCCMRMVPMLLV